MYQTAKLGGWIILSQWEPRSMDKITRESAIKTAGSPKAELIRLCFNRGEVSGRTNVPYYPVGDMWNEYDYYRGYDAGEVIFEEANGHLLEDDDE